MGLINKVASGVDNISTKAGSFIYDQTLKKGAAHMALGEKVNMAEVATKAAHKANYAYGLTQAGVYGAGIGATVGLVNNVGNDTLGGTIGGTGLGAIGGAGVGAVAAAIAKGLR